MAGYDRFWSGNGANGTEEDNFRRVLYGVDIRHQHAPNENLAEGLIKFTGKEGFFELDKTILSKHLLLLGGVGTGKTNVFYQIVRQSIISLEDNDIILIFDTKGDYYKRFYNSSDEHHILIGNNNEYRRNSYLWNIFDELKDRNGSFTKESEILAKDISKGLFSEMESETQPFFAIAASDLFSKTMIYLMRKYNSGQSRNEPTTDQLVSFVKNATAKTYREMLSDELCPDFLSALSYIGESENTTPQALGVLGYINAMVNDLFVGVFAGKDSFNRKSFSMRNLVRKRGRAVIFIEYDLEIGQVLSPIYRTLFDLALKEALANRKSEETGNIYLIIDEFKLLPKLQHIDDALNFGRSFGVKVCAGLQSIHQLYDVYGEDHGKVLAAGFMNSICFMTWDLDSRKFISDRFGETYETQTIEGNEVQREGHVVSDWDILSLNVGEAYVNLTTDPITPPFRFFFNNYDR